VKRLDAGIEHGEENALARALRQFGEVIHVLAIGRQRELLLAQQAAGVNCATTKPRLKKTDTPSAASPESGISGVQSLDSPSCIAPREPTMAVTL
jgi:hypothetical protein